MSYYCAAKLTDVRSFELMNTKEKILKEALKQFNASGVEQVTTRHIAKGLSMSQGNLHYHFPNKDELIEAFRGKIAKSIGDKI